MRASFWICAAGLAAFGAAPAAAQDASQLAQSKGCMTCHAVAQTKMGPSFKDISAKFKGQGDAAAILVAELKDGKGHVKANATEAELQQLVAFVLATQ
jgi:cytochrome c